MLLAGGGNFGWIPWIGEKLGGDAQVIAGTQHYYAAGLIVCMMAVMSIIVWRRVKNTAANLVPADGVTLTNFFDAGVEAVSGTLDDVIGAGGRKHLPLIATVFFFIFFSNILGLVPGMNPSTSNLSANLSVAACIFFYYNYMGIKAHGFGPYFKHFMGPMIWIAPLFFAIEIVSHVVRPLSLSVRLFANMTADHAVLAVFTDMTKIGIPVVFLCLGLFVSLVQAFVFSLLSVVYIALAEAHMDDH